MRAESINSFEDVHKILKRFIPPARSHRGAYTLERMQILMMHLGNPQNTYKVVHVAGTSGKTSTAYYVASFLKQASVKTGLTVSPHIDEVNERVQINLKPLAAKSYFKELGVFLRLVEKSTVNPTYFELLTAFALWEFKRQGCEYVVVEVGLGGLLDATNVITSSNKINIITDIGLDHEEVLGKTRGVIASQKAGIIKPHNTVICYEQDEEVMEVIREAAHQQQADLHEVWPIKNSELPSSLPLFQRRNWYLAYASYQLLSKKYDLPALLESNLEQSIMVNIPARMETHTVGKKIVILDGSHNQQKLGALVASIRHAYPKQKFTILLSFVSTKQTKLESCIAALLPIAAKIYITAFNTEDNERVSVDPLKIVTTCEKLHFENWEVINRPDQAIATLMKNTDRFILVTGSFYLLNHIRPHLDFRK